MTVHLGSLDWLLPAHASTIDRSPFICVYCQQEKYVYRSPHPLCARIHRCPCYGRSTKVQMDAALNGIQPVRLLGTSMGKKKTGIQVSKSNKSVQTLIDHVLKMSTEQIKMLYSNTSKPTRFRGVAPCAQWISF